MKSCIWPLLLCALTCLVSCLLCADASTAQSASGTISGAVTDASGGTVADATVKAINDQSGQTRTVLTNTSGEFQIQSLPSGSYSVEVTAQGFSAYRVNKIVVTSGVAINLPIKLVVESERKVVIVNGEPDDFKPATATLGNLNNRQVQDLPLSMLVFTRTVMDDQQSRLLSDVAKNDASVGEDYAPVGWYQDFMIRGFTLDLASGFKINGLAAAGEQLFPLENKESVEFLHGVDSDEVGVGSGGGLVNYVTKRPAAIRTAEVGTDQRGSLYAAIDLGVFFGARQQFGIRANFAGESMHSYVGGADGTREFTGIAADWKISPSTYLKGDFDYQHLVQKSVGGYQLLGGAAVPTNISPDVMLGFQTWAKPNTYDDFNTSIRLDHNFSSSWHIFAAVSRSHTLLDDNIAYPYGCYYAASCASGGTPPYFFGPTGDYDVYDYRSPGELRINDQFESILQGQVKTGSLVNNISVGTSLQRRSVNIPTPVYNYVGTENIYLPEQAFPHSTGQPGPVYLAEDTHQYALIVADHIHLPKRIDVTVGGQYDTLHDFLYPSKSLWLPQYSISYRPLQPVMFYVNYSVALSLGLQAPFWANINPNAFLAPFFTRQVEAGAKYQPGNRILLSLAIYRMRAPFFYPKLIDAQNDIEFVSEGHETHRGLELSAQGKINNRLRLTGSSSFLSAISADTGTPAFDDKQVIDVPHFRTSWFADIDVPFISGLHLLPGWSYSSAKYATRDDSVHVPGYNLFNLGARYNPGGEWNKVTFHLYAENIFNKRYWKDTGASYGDTFLHPGAPATVRLTMQYSF